MLFFINMTAIVAATNPFFAAAMLLGRAMIAQREAAVADANAAIERAMAGQRA